jgi:hypothetical protein
VPKRILVDEMEEYGFSDYFGIGDIIGHTEGRFLHDGVITAMTKSWLRAQPKALESQRQPWFIAVNLVNPHHVMYYNTDLPDQPAKQAATAMMPLNREPGTGQYGRKWDSKLPTSRHQPVSGPGRSAAHEDFAVGRSALVGRVPDEDPRWHRLKRRMPGRIDYTATWPGR